MLYYMLGPKYKKSNPTVYGASSFQSNHKSAVASSAPSEAPYSLGHESQHSSLITPCGPPSSVFYWENFLSIMQDFIDKLATVIVHSDRKCFKPTSMPSPE